MDMVQRRSHFRDSNDNPPMEQPDPHSLVFHSHTRDSLRGVIPLRLHHRRPWSHWDMPTATPGAAQKGSNSRRDHKGGR